MSVSGPAAAPGNPAPGKVPAPRSASGGKTPAEDPVPSRKAESGPLQPVGEVLKRIRGSTLLVEGRVLTGEQQPVAGAAVSFFAERDARAELQDLISSTSTGQKGFFRLRIDRPGPGWMRVDKPGFASMEGWLEAPPGSVLVREFHLQPARARVTGRVVDSSRSPIPGAFLFLSFQQVFSGPGQPMLTPRTAFSNPSGKFSVDGLPAGPVGVAAGAEGFLPSQGRTAVLEQGGATDMEFVLKKGIPVPLSIRSQAGRPLPGATAVLSGGFVQRADEAGVVLLSVPAEAAEAEVEIRAEGYLTRRVSFHPGSPPRQVILEEAGILSGTVSSETGRPLPGAYIQVLESRNGLEHLERVVKSDHRGMFFIPATLPGPGQLVVTKEGFIETVVEFEVPREIDGREILMKGAEGGLYGRAVDGQGHPVAPIVAIVRFRGPPEIEMARTFSNPEGLFAFPDLPAGLLTLHLLAPGRSLSATIENLEIRKGELHGELIVSLEPAPRTPMRKGGIH